MTAAGEHFARALAGKDGTALSAVLADTVDFEALTPRRHWQADSARAVTEIILGQWFGPDADIAGLSSLTTGQVAGREHVCYRLRVRAGGSDYLVEQQAYYDADGPRIRWLRVLCSGYQPVAARDRADAR